jgi:hypothetical protein
MNAQSFSLKPFPSNKPRSDLEISGSITRHSDTLAIRYTLHGALTELHISAPAAAPVRKHGLWEETCFECFLAVENSPRYWEFNLSPAGHWNGYRFAAYRQGMQEETSFQALPSSVESQRDALLLAVELDLGRIIPTNQTLEIAVSTVIRHKDGTLTYWALTHPGPQPDFHRRDSFIITQ